MNANEAPAQLTDEDLIAIQASLDEGAEGLKYSVLETWTELFLNVPIVAKERVTPGLASFISGTWPKISFQETPRYHAIYHERLAEVGLALSEILKDDTVRAKAFKNVGPDDAEHNGHLYDGVLLEWQKLITTWESQWRAEDPESHIIAAVIADIHKFTLSPSGIVEHLSSIDYRYTDECKAAHSEVLTALAAELEEANE